MTNRRRVKGQRRGVLPALLSAISFLLYGLDKRAATRGGWRTSEARLHFFELLGGWPGALLGLTRIPVAWLQNLPF